MRSRLSSGRFGAAAGFGASADRHRALPLLLPYVPIVVWPRYPDVPADEEFRQRVRDLWHRQPHDFADAYRRHDTDHGPATPCLCDLHAVSHDETWLSFCRVITTRAVAAPKETR
ncbi:hypothetical protein ACIQBJ_14080 [Kitasatospora sp. NPDC088391]|uniref:hypothetical protein n=1 Tax=Kitasatospora sp. NPDC088391 TaxID=3364074 RepID=UPI00380614B6